MKRFTAAWGFLFLLALTGCLPEKEKADEPNQLRRSDPIVLPPPAQPSFGKSTPAEIPTVTVTAPQVAALSATLPEPSPLPEQKKEDLPQITAESAPTLQMMFERYATGCYGLDARFMKVVAQAESGLDPKNHTGKYVGLFQLDPNKEPEHACPMFIGPFKSYLNCDNLEDAETNIAVSAHRFDRMFQGRKDWQPDTGYPGILQVCPDATADEAVALAYVGHNNGPAVLKHILANAKKKGWCKHDKQEEGVRSFYKTRGNDQGWYEKPEAGKEPEMCHNAAEIKGQWAFHCVTEDYGARKWRYGLNKVVAPLKEAGVTKLYQKTEADPQKCPALAVPARRLSPPPAK